MTIDIQKIYKATQPQRFKLLEIINENEGLRFQDIVRRMNMKPSAVHKHLRVLISNQLVSFHQGWNYRITTDGMIIFLRIKNASNF